MKLCWIFLNMLAFKLLLNPFMKGLNLFLTFAVLVVTLGIMPEVSVSQTETRLSDLAKKEAGAEDFSTLEMEPEEFVLKWLIHRRERPAERYSPDVEKFNNRLYMEYLPAQRKQSPTFKDSKEIYDVYNQSDTYFTVLDLAFEGAGIWKHLLAPGVDNFIFRQGAIPSGLTENHLNAVIKYFVSIQEIYDGVWFKNASIFGGSEENIFSKRYKKTIESFQETLHYQEMVDHVFQLLVHYAHHIDRVENLSKHTHFSITDGRLEIKNSDEKTPVLSERDGILVIENPDGMVEAEVSSAEFGFLPEMVVFLKNEKNHAFLREFLANYLPHCLGDSYFHLRYNREAKITGMIDRGIHADIREEIKRNYLKHSKKFFYSRLPVLLGNEQVKALPPPVSINDTPKFTSLKSKLLLINEDNLTETLNGFSAIVTDYQENRKGLSTLSLSAANDYLTQLMSIQNLIEEINIRAVPNIFPFDKSLEKKYKEPSKKNEYNMQRKKRLDDSYEKLKNYQKALVRYERDLDTFIEIVNEDIEKLKQNLQPHFDLLGYNPLELENIVTRPSQEITKPSDMTREDVTPQRINGSDEMNATSAAGKIYQLAYNNKVFKGQNKIFQQAYVKAETAIHRVEVLIRKHSSNLASVMVSSVEPRPSVETEEQQLKKISNIDYDITFALRYRLEKSYERFSDSLTAYSDRRKRIESLDKSQIDTLNESLVEVQNTISEFFVRVVPVIADLIEMERYLSEVDEAKGQKARFLSGDKRVEEIAGMVESFNDQIKSLIQNLSGDLSVIKDDIYLSVDQLNFDPLDLSQLLKISELEVNQAGSAGAQEAKEFSTLDKLVIASAANRIEQMEYDAEFMTTQLKIIQAVFSETQAALDLQEKKRRKRVQTKDSSTLSCDGVFK